MIQIGKWNLLPVTRETAQGFYLGKKEEEEVLLPGKFAPDKLKTGQQLNVFIYRDNEGRKTATTQKPAAELGQFAILQVNEVTGAGAFLKWGIDKDILAPFSDQKIRMHPGGWYFVRICLDPRTDRLYASSVLEKFLSNETLTVSTGDAVRIQIIQTTDLGWNVVVNDKHKGLLYKNEVFRPLAPGEITDAWVKWVRPGNKLDISLQPIGFEKSIDTYEQKVMDAIKEGKGFLALNDDSDPDEIKSILGLSKKAFKRAIGGLYKKKMIRLTDNGIEAATVSPID